MTPCLQVLSLVLLTSAVGCTGWDWSGSSARKPTAKEERKEADAKIKAAHKAIEEYGYAQRAELIATLNAELAETDQEIARMEAKLLEKTGEARVQSDAAIAALRLRIAASKKELADASASSEEEWDDLRDRLKVAKSELDEAAKAARRWAADSNAPE